MWALKSAAQDKHDATHFKRVTHLFSSHCGCVFRIPPKTNVVNVAVSCGASRSPQPRPGETAPLSLLTARFIGSPASGCMIPSHLTPDSGVIDSDLCQRRQQCQRENMCVSSHQPPLCLCWGHQGWNNKKILESRAANPLRAAVSHTNIYTCIIFEL